MRTNTAVCFLILFTFIRPSLGGEEVTIPLPKDGAWARYHVTTTHEPGTVGGNSTRKETVRFVGTSEIQGVRHRWFEQSFGNLQNGTTNVLRTRVSETDLKSSWPFAADRHWWHKMGDLGVVETRTLGPEYGVFSLVFPGPYKTAKPVKDPRIIDYQRGRLEIQERLTGRQEISFQENGHDRTFEMDYSAWRHPDIPVGLAAAKVSFRAKEYGLSEPREAYTVEFVLEDCGEDAKTVLPESN